jgi:hypothetical protein
MDHLLSVIALMAEADPRLAYDSMSRILGQADVEAIEIDPSTTPHGRLILGEVAAPARSWQLGEGDTLMIHHTYPSGVNTCSIPAAELTIVYDPWVVVGERHYVSDPALDPLRSTGRFDEIDMERGDLIRLLVLTGLVDREMPAEALDLWLLNHGADRRLLSEPLPLAA